MTAIGGAAANAKQEQTALRPRNLSSSSASSSMEPNEISEQIRSAAAKNACT